MNSARSIRAAALLLVLAGLAAYHNSFQGVFLFDDHPTILENPSIRHLGDLGQVLSPPIDSSTVGRPVGNVTLAVNYALGGVRPWGYHAVNLLIHLGAGLALLGIMRRTFLQPALRTRFGGQALCLAVAVAGLWLLHPIQTEAVTYVVQRVESLTALFLLLTLYGFIRATDTALGAPDCPSRTSRGGAGAGPVPKEGRRDAQPRGPGLASPDRPLAWLGLSVGACLLGMGTKEVMVGAPLLVLLYDRTFVSGSVRAALNRRRAYYAGLALTWVLLAWLVGADHGRGGTAGFGTAASPWRYLLTQCGAIVHYLRLVLWPRPLILDYGWDLVREPLSVLPQAALLLLLGASTLWAIARRSPLGVAGAWFFVILAPSSSVVPVASQTVAEHRLYLPLAAVLAVAVAGGYRLLGRRILLGAAALAVAWGWVTERRNADYGSEATMARGNVEAMPDNPRALAALGNFLYRSGDTRGAVTCLEKALRLAPGYPHAAISLGAIAYDLGQIGYARRLCEQALRLQPSSPDAHHNLGLIDAAGGDNAGALAEYRAALALNPEFPEAEADLGLALWTAGRKTEAIARYERALGLDPNLFAARNNLGTALLDSGRYAQAQTQFEAAVQLRPRSAQAQGNLGLALYAQGRNADAIAHLLDSIQLDGRSAATHRNLALALDASGRPVQARQQYQAALALDPADSIARSRLGR